MKNIFKKISENKKNFLLGFLIFFLLILSFFAFEKFFLDQKKLEKNIEISSNWYNISEKKYLNESDFSFSKWDIVQRNIFLKNNWIFEVKNFELEDYNIFSQKFVNFLGDIKWWEVAILQYKTILSWYFLS